jgi:glucose-1-phosphate adenylyltransferase
VLAGGEGTRLRPLTAHQAKPAVHFACGHRIVDFVLGNLVNSGVSSIYLLAQYKPASLAAHVASVWRPQMRAQGGSIDVILPDHLELGSSFMGTADAVRRCLHLLARHSPEVVAVFAADHVYRMDVRQMARHHLSHDADVTVAGIPVPIALASSFGTMATDRGGVIRQFQEKPAYPQPIPGRPDLAYASMGNYLFKPEVLVALLQRAARLGGTDFGKDILPALPSSGRRAIAYDFARNRIPGIQAYEERTYWRDVGTLAALAQAQQDVKGTQPRFDLRNRVWPIRRDLVARLARMHALPAFESGRYAA